MNDLTEDQRQNNFRVTVETIVLNDDNDVLLLKRHELAHTAPGRWAPPGGKVELEETPEEGALREIQEETGLANIEIIDFIGHYALKFQKKDVWVDRLACYYLGRATGDLTITLSPREHQDYQWVSLDKMMDPSNPFDFLPYMNDVMQKTKEYLRETY